MKHVLVVLSCFAAGFGVLLCRWNSQGMAAVPTNFTEIVERAEIKSFDAATILYLDPKVTTRTAVTPQALARIGCQIVLRSASPNWTSLVSILKAERPQDTDEQAAEVRWGIGFR